MRQQWMCSLCLRLWYSAAGAFYCHGAGATRITNATLVLYPQMESADYMLRMN